MKFFRNLAGRLKGYGTCPNCGDSWSWKESGRVMYSEGSGVMICEECLKHPENLDTAKISFNLLSYDWPRDDVFAVVRAVNKLKEK